MIHECHKMGNEPFVKIEVVLQRSIVSTILIVLTKPNLECKLR